MSLHSKTPKPKVPFFTRLHLFCCFLGKHHPVCDLHQGNLQVRLFGRANGEPARTGAHGGVCVNLKTEFVDVKLKGTVLIENKDAYVIHSCDHCFFFWFVDDSKVSNA